LDYRCLLPAPTPASSACAVCCRSFEQRLPFVLDAAAATVLPSLPPLLPFYLPACTFSRSACRSGFGFCYLLSPASFGFVAVCRSPADPRLPFIYRFYACLDYTFCLPPAAVPFLLTQITAVHVFACRCCGGSPACLRRLHLHIRFCGSCSGSFCLRLPAVLRSGLLPAMVSAVIPPFSWIFTWILVPLRSAMPGFTCRHLPLWISHLPPAVLLPFCLPVPPACLHLLPFLPPAAFWISGCGVRLPVHWVTCAVPPPAALPPPALFCLGHLPFWIFLLDSATGFWISFLLLPPACLPPFRFAFHRSFYCLPPAWVCRITGFCCCRSFCAVFTVLVSLCTTAVSLHAGFLPAACRSGSFSRLPFSWIGFSAGYTAAVSFCHLTPPPPAINFLFCRFVLPFWMPAFSCLPFWILPPAPFACCLDAATWFCACHLRSTCTACLRFVHRLPFSAPPACVLYRRVRFTVRCFTGPAYLHGFRSPFCSATCVHVRYRSRCRLPACVTATRLYRSAVLRFAASAFSRYTAFAVLPLPFCRLCFLLPLSPACLPHCTCCTPAAACRTLRTATPHVSFYLPFYLRRSFWITVSALPFTAQLRSAAVGLLDAARLYLLDCLRVCCCRVLSQSLPSPDFSFTHVH